MVNHISEVLTHIDQKVEISILLIGLLILALVVYKRCAAHKWSKKQGGFAFTAGLYIALIFMHTLVLRSPYKGVHLKLIPLWRLMKAGRYEFHEVIKEILTNVIMLLPLGFIIHVGFPNIKIQIVIAIGLSLSLIIETLQYVSQRGAFEVDDLIFNILGIFLGYILGCLILHQKTKLRD